MSLPCQKCHSPGNTFFYGGNKPIHCIAIKSLVKKQDELEDQITAEIIGTPLNAREKVKEEFRLVK